MSNFGIGQQLGGQSTLFWGGTISLLHVMIWLLWGTLTPFVVGFLLAYILSPLVKYLENKGIPRWVSSLVLMASIFAFIFEFFFILIPFLENQLSLVVKHLPHYSEEFSKRIEPLLDMIEPYMNVKNEVSHLQEKFSAPIKDIFSFGIHFFLGLWTSGSVLANFILLLFFAPLMTFYFLKDWDRMWSQLRALAPLKSRFGIHELTEQIDQALGNYARGQFIVCLILAIYYMSALSIIGLPYSVALGVISGFLIFIPYIGFFTSFFLAVGVALVASGSSSLFMGIGVTYVIGQAIEGLFLTPFFVGGRTGLHPLWILFALFASGAVFGIAGVVFCLPLAAVVRVLVLWVIKFYKRSIFYTGEEMVKKEVTFQS